MGTARVLLWTLCFPFILMVGCKESLEPETASAVSAESPWRSGLCEFDRHGEKAGGKNTGIPCEVLPETGEPERFRVRSASGGDLIEKVRLVTVTVLASGQAEVGGISAAGSKSRWGRARLAPGKGNCWVGADFRLCWQLKPSDRSHCGAIPLLSTQEAMAKSPRVDLDAERLALRISEDLVAEDAAYERILADLKALRSFAKGKTVARRTWPHHSIQSVILKPKPEVVEAILDGSYQGLDCLNTWYGGRLLPVSPPIDYIFVKFDRWYLGKKIAESYGRHPDIRWSGPSGFGGAGDDIRLCHDRIGGTHRYLFSHGSGDCPGGCIDWVHRGYEVTDKGEVTALEPAWTIPGLGKSSERPAWAHDGCFREPYRPTDPTP